MPSSRLTSKGQITLPKMVRDALGVEAGDRVAFRIGEAGEVLLEAETVELLTLRGRLRPERRGVSVDQMARVVRERGGRARS
jgi:AbrB family looped-hinge helix DNA binding protein